MNACCVRGENCALLLALRFSGSAQTAPNLTVPSLVLPLRSGFETEPVSMVQRKRASASLNGLRGGVGIESPLSGKNRNFLKPAPPWGEEEERVLKLEAERAGAVMHRPCTFVHIRPRAGCLSLNISRLRVAQEEEQDCRRWCPQYLPRASS